MSWAKLNEKNFCELNVTSRDATGTWHQCDILRRHSDARITCRLTMSPDLNALSFIKLCSPMFTDSFDKETYYFDCQCCTFGFEKNCDVLFCIIGSSSPEIKRKITNRLLVSKMTDQNCGKYVCTNYIFMFFLFSFFFIFVCIFWLPVAREIKKEQRSRTSRFSDTHVKIF